MIFNCYSFPIFRTALHLLCVTFWYEDSRNDTNLNQQSEQNEANLQYHHFAESSKWLQHDKQVLRSFDDK